MSFKPVVHPNARKVSHVLELTDEDMLKEISVSSVIGDLRHKVAEEEARLARLLPEAPIGYTWVQQVEWHDDLTNNRVLLRVVYRLEQNYGC